MPVVDVRTRRAATHVPPPTKLTKRVATREDRAARHAPDALDRAMGMPRRSARSPIYDDVINGPGAELPERRLRELKSDHQRMILVSKSTHVILDRILLDDEGPALREMERLKHALDRLIAFFRTRE